MNCGLALKLGLRTELLSKPFKATALDGNELFTITHITEPLELHINKHKEWMIFYLFVTFICCNPGIPMVVHAQPPGELVKLGRSLGGEMTVSTIV